MEKTRFTSCGKLTTEFQCYNQLDLGATKKPRYESRKMVVNQAQAVNSQICTTLKINQAKTKRETFYKKIRTLDLKIQKQISPCIVIRKHEWDHMNARFASQKTRRKLHRKVFERTKPISKTRSFVFTSKMLEKHL